MNCFLAVQDIFTKPAVPPISVKHYIRNSSEDRGSSSRSYNQTTARPATDGSSRPTTGGLYEKILQKRRNVSNKARTEIRDTLRRLRVKSYEDPSNYNFSLCLGRVVVREV